MNPWNERALVVGAFLALTAVPVRAQDVSAAATRQAGGITLDELMNVDVQQVFGASRFSQEVIDIRNICDRAYGDPGAAEHVQSLIPQPGRTVSVRATWHF